MELIPFRTLTEALDAAPEGRPFVTMWRNDEDVETVTFGEFGHRARAHAAGFHAHGVCSGDVVILIMPQGIPLMTAFTGAMLLGAVPTILAYPNFKVDPAKYRSGLAGVSANLKARLVLLDEAFPSELLSCVALGDGARVVRDTSSVAPSAAVPSVEAPVDARSLAFLQHSAGTTGLQKGVALSHAAALRQLNHLAAALQMTEHDRIYSWLPLYHDMGLIACFLLPLARHVPVVMQSPEDWVLRPDTMLRLISEHRCTLAWVPNFTLQFLARRVPPEERVRWDLSSLRALINCSEPVRAQSMEEFLAAYVPCGFRPDALQASYAMAENVFAVTQSGTSGRSAPPHLWIDARQFREEGIAVPVADAADGALCLVSSGQCLPGNQIRVVSPAGADLADGSLGEIVIRSDSLFSGYHNRLDLTGAVLRDGWYWSGDLGVRVDGELYVVGRKKDLIIVAGENIYPEDVEEIVCRHPAIHDGRAVALGLYNPDLGTEEIVIVAEVERQEELSNAVAIERAVRNAVLAELGVAPHAVYLKPPRWIVKSTAGKPARSATRDRLLVEHPELAEERSSARDHTVAEWTGTLIDYIVREVVRRPDIRIDADTPLVSSGLIDSLALVDVLVMLEEVTSTRIPAGKIRPRDLDTVRLMLATAGRVGKPRKMTAPVSDAQQRRVG